MNDNQVLECIGPVKQEPVISLCEGPPDSNIPEYTVGDVCFDADGPLKLSDFGGAWRFGERPQHVNIYPIYRPLEIIGESGQLTNDTGLDLWMLGCTVSVSMYLVEKEELILLRCSESLQGDHYLMNSEIIICERKSAKLLTITK